MSHVLVYVLYINIYIGIYDFVVEWGDQSGSSHITSYDQAEIKHTYARPGLYTIHLNGFMIGFAFGGDERTYVEHPCCRMITDISQWGCIGLGRHGFQFAYCSELDITALDSPDLTGVTDMRYMFYDALSLNHSFKMSFNPGGAGSVGKVSHDHLHEIDHVHSSTSTQSVKVVKMIRHHRMFFQSTSWC